MPFSSQFWTLTNEFMSDEQIDLIFAESNFDKDLKDVFQFIQIQWYMPGDFIIPHKDTYDVIKLHLVTLTHSNVDGLVCQDGDTLRRVLDRRGQKIDFDYDAWHWVDPVQRNRYSLVIGE